MQNESLLQNWDAEGGLPADRVQAVARTTDGYLWIATWNGLARFDGIRFVIFNTNNTPALTDNHVSCLLVDHDGALWIGAHNGRLVKYHHGKFAAVDLKECAPRIGWIHCLAQDAQGAMWIAANGVGVIRLQNDHHEVFGTASGLPTIPVWQLVCDTKNRLWALADGRVLEFAQGHWRPPEGVPPLSQPVRTIAASEDGGLWVGTMADTPLGNRGGRILKLKNHQWMDEQEPYPWDQDSFMSRVNMLLEDHSGRLWCGTEGAGVFYRNPAGTWQLLSKNSDLSHILTGCLGDDRGGSIWLGTKAAGIYRIQLRTVTTLSPPPNMEQSFFLTVCATKDGSVWGGTVDRGVLRFHDGIVTLYGAGQGLANSHVAVLFKDSHDNLLAGTWGGLFRFNGEKFEAVPGPPALSQAVIALSEDREGNLWVGTDGGLVCMHNGVARVFGKEDGLPSTIIRAVTEDSVGQIWVAVSGNGLFRKVGERFERYTACRWQGEDLFRALYADTNGVLWIASEGAGLICLKNRHFTQYRIEDGFPQGYLQAVLPDGNGNLWFGSDNGIVGCPKQMLEQYVRGRSRPLNCWRLSQSDGLANKICTGAGQPTATLAPDGRLWFPNGDALAVFDPHHLPQTPQIQAPVIEEALVDGEVQTPDSDGWLRIKSDMRRLELHFTSPCLDSPELLQFQIWMEGLDKDWVNARETRVTSYGHLAPGHYKFRVAVAGPDRKWLESPQSLKIDVLPNLYQRRPVQVVGALALLAIVAAAAWRVERVRFRRRLDRLELQRARDQERQRIARDIHDDLGSGLTEIIMVSDRLREDLVHTPVSEKQVCDISARARALTRAMDEVVWAINPHDDTLEGLITYLDDFAQEHLTLSGVRYRLEAPPELPELQLSAETRHSLYLASKEALNNAARHAGASEVWMRLHLNGSGFTLSIEDNGRGCDLDQQTGRGHGLRNMQKRLEDIGGHCNVISVPGSGTQVRFLVTVRQKITRE